MRSRQMDYNKEPFLPAQGDERGREPGSRRMGDRREGAHRKGAFSAFHGEGLFPLFPAMLSAIH